MYKKIILGNWKMKKDFKASLEDAKKFQEKFKDFNNPDKEIVVCPNHVALAGVGENLKPSPIKLGAQNVFWEQQGAYTGEISPSTLVEAGCQYAIIGHSERRKYLLENYSMMHQKVKAVLDVDGLIPVVCIGEENEDRKTDRRDYVLLNQLQQALGGIDIVTYGKQIIVAYEPVWAIGSGTVIDPSEAVYAHKIIKLALNDMFGLKIVEESFKIVYGGSVTATNVEQFSDLENMDGLLVGGASLDPEEFYNICEKI